MNKFEFNKKRSDEVTNTITKLGGTTIISIELNNKPSKGEYIINAKDGDGFIEREVRLINFNENEEIIPFTKFDIEAINRWIFTSEYKYLNIRDRNYKGLFRKKEFMWYRNAEKGYIELIYRLEPFMYGNRIMREVGVNGNYNFILKTLGDSNEPIIYPELYIRNVSDNTLTLLIDNKSIVDNKLTVEDVKPREEIYVSGSNDYIRSKMDRYRVITSNRNYTKIKAGNNSLSLISNELTKVGISYIPKYTMKEGDLFWVSK